jgi:hypothetical protein
MTDRRYGHNTYGNGALYGTSDATEAIAWGVEIDWDEDGVYDTNEASRMTHLSVTRGRKKLLQEVGQGFEKIPSGKAVITLRNDDGRFDAWNTSSALYPNVNYGKDVRIRVRDMNTTADPYPVFSGFITNIVPVGYGDRAKVVIYVSDRLDYLRNQSGRVSMQENISPDDAISLILDSVGWTWGTNFETSTDTIRYWWASGNKQAISEIEDVATSFLGYFYIDASGNARYKTRSSVTDSVADFLQEQLNKDIENPQPYEISRNLTRLKVHPRTAASTGVIWQLVGNTPSIQTGANNALRIFANYTYNNVAVPAKNVITPVATTDFLINSQSDGLGSNLTGSCTVTMTDFGDTAQLTITNLSGSLGYITFLRIRGDAIYEPNVSDVTYPSDTTTVSRPREFVLDLTWQQDINVAGDIANVIGAFYGATHPIPHVKMENYPAIMFAPDLFEIVTFTMAKIGIEGESFRVGGIDLETDSNYENCQSVHFDYYLEPYISGSDFMQWDTNATWDTTTIFGY